MVVSSSREREAGDEEENACAKERNSIEEPSKSLQCNVDTTTLQRLIKPKVPSAVQILPR